MLKTAILFLVSYLFFIFYAGTFIIHYQYLLLLALILLVWFRWFNVSIIIIALLWIGLNTQYKQDNQLPASHTGQNIITTGTIATLPKRGDNVLRFLFKPDDKTLPHKILVSWYYSKNLTPNAGEKWQLHLHLKAPHGRANPGGFNYEQWLFSQGIGATAYVKTTSNTKLKSASLWQINHLRELIQKKLHQLLPNSPQRPLIEGLAIGVRDNLTHSQWDLLKATGTNHLLAISGLHIGLAATLGFWLFKLLWGIRSQRLLIFPAQQVGAIGGILFAISYALLAGLSLPSQRALIMITAAMIALMLKRQFKLTQILSLSLLLVLIYDPFAVISVSFWLSYGAVVLILLSCSGRYPATKGQWFLLPFWMTLGLAPLLALFFGQISLISPIANIIAIPIVSFVIVPLTLLALVLLFISNTLASWLLQSIAWLLEQLWSYLSWLADIPWAQWHTIPPPWWIVVGAILAVTLLLLPRGIPAKWLGLILILPLIFYQPSRPEQGSFRFTVLDVGQGLASVLETQNHTLVYDTGPRYSYRSNAGSDVITPYLKSRGIKQVDLLMVSHGDSDHSGGVRGLRRSIKIDKTLTSANNIDHSQPCYRGQHWQWDNVDFKVLSPDQNQTDSSNNRSCVLQIISHNQRLLLTADIEAPTEQQLIQRYGKQLKSDILVVPHHGSATSSTESFIRYVSPQYALFSLGFHNRFHFPKSSVIRRYQQQAIRIFRTDQQGAIIIDDKGNISAWRQKYRQIWTTD